MQRIAQDLTLKAHQRNRMRQVAVALTFGLAAWIASADPARADSTLQFPSREVFVGEKSSIPLESITDFSYQGFSVSAAYDPSVLQILEVTHKGTIVEAIPADFFQVNLFPDEGSFVIGCLVDSSPPFDDRQIPGPDIPMAVAQVIFEVAESVPPQTTQIRFVDGFGSPPIANLLSIDNQSVPPDHLVDGVITIVIVHRNRFIRGDANNDTTVDIADPVFILNYLFMTGPAPNCPDGADGNDDERVDLADPIFILQYNFQGGLKPPSPFPNPGIDPTPGLRRDLDCAEGVNEG